eukprot:2569907-Pleurochrysis_carterae.AAC.1
MSAVGGVRGGARALEGGSNSQGKKSSIATMIRWVVDTADQVAYEAFLYAEYQIRSQGRYQTYVTWLTWCPQIVGKSVTEGELEKVVRHCTEEGRAASQRSNTVSDSRITCDARDAKDTGYALTSWTMTCGCKRLAIHLSE